VWRIRQVRYGPQHRATTNTIRMVTLAALVSSLYNRRVLAWLSLHFMELVRLEKLARICWLVEWGVRRFGERIACLCMELTDVRLRDETEFLLVRIEFPLAAVNILT